jgi:hypothetical protein
LNRLLGLAARIWGCELFPARGRILLGAEYDDALREALMETLREFNAVEISHWYGVGGSQEVERLDVQLHGARVEVEAETYVGLSISGEPRVIARIAARVRQRTTV